MWFTRVSIGNPVLATMMMLAFVVLGLFSYNRLPVDQFPDGDDDPHGSTMPLTKVRMAT
jgi:Cu/Ag efflux pump CusA